MNKVRQIFETFLAKIKAFWAAIISCFMFIPDSMPDVRQRFDDLKTRTPAKIRNIRDNMSI